MEAKIDGCQMKKKYLVRWKNTLYGTGWQDGWMDGCKSRVKDCLQQSKIGKVIMSRGLLLHDNIIIYSYCLMN